MAESEFYYITPNIQKNVLKKGIVGRKPSYRWKCRIKILFDGQENQKDITIGDGSTAMDRMVESCVESMHLEEESSFIIKINNESFRVNIVLQSFDEKSYIFQWSEEEKLEASNAYKRMGTELFKNDHVEEAFYKFSTALKFTLLLDSVLEVDDPNETVTNLRTALYNNLASCQLHFKNYSSVIKLCSDSIKLQPTAKAFYRRAIAHMEVKDYEKAENDIMDLLKIEPKNKAALEKYKLIRELDKSNRENYETIVKNMFR